MDENAIEIIFRVNRYHIDEFFSLVSDTVFSLNCFLLVLGFIAFACCACVLLTIQNLVKRAEKKGPHR